MRDVIRRERARTRLRERITAGMKSGPGSELDADYFARLRARIADSE